MTTENLTEAQAVSAKVKSLYINATPQNTRALVESIAEQTGKSKESVTQILVRAGLYVKPEAVKISKTIYKSEIKGTDAPGYHVETSPHKFKVEPSEKLFGMPEQKKLEE
jgi:hypothetical protein